MLGAAGGACVRKPIRGTFSGCCAPTMPTTASNAPANRIDASAVFLNSRHIGPYLSRGGEQRKVLSTSTTFQWLSGKCLSLVSDENTGRPTCRYRGNRGKGLIVGAAFFAYKTKRDRVNLLLIGGVARELFGWIG